MNFRWFSFHILFLFIGLFVLSNESLLAQKKSKINFSADNIIYDESLGNKAKRLVDNVVFEHDGVLMYCDSAYQYPVTNSLDAFGRVHIKQGDTLDLYGDSLKYSGNTKIAQLNGNVKLITKNTTLTCPKLTYYRIQGYAYYDRGGVIVNKKENNRLYSNIGHFYPKISTFYFKDSVRLYNPEYIIETDTLDYDSKNEITYFQGPTNIISDENFIYCENGYYNTITNISSYSKNSYLWNENQKLSGDSLFYDRNLGFGEVFRNVEIEDTVEKVLINGDYSNFYEDKDSATVIGDSTLLTQFMVGDTLYLHADTFQIVSDSIANSRELFAYHKVKFFKRDLQGKCDSMIYSFKDSLIKMFVDPIIWSGENQLTSDYIEIQMANDDVHSILMDQNAFIASLVDTVRFNQIRGKVINGYFKEGELRVVDVNGNGQTIYYSTDDDGKYIGVNRGESSDLMMYLKDNQLNKITFINDPDATLYPVLEISPEELRLKGFIWRKNLRPLSKEDIYIWKD